MSKLDLGPAGVALTVSDTYLARRPSWSGWDTRPSGCPVGRSTT